MPKLDPKADIPNETIPANIYILGLTWFNRRQAKTSGKDYLSVKVEVASGPQKGSGFFTAMSLDLSKAGAVKRWQLLCEALGIEEQFELGDSHEGTAEEGDENIRRLFVGRAFKAEVGVSKNGQYVNNEIKSYAYPRQYTDKDREAIAAWEAEWKAKKDDFGAPDDMPPDAGDDRFDEELDDFDDDLNF